MSVLGRIALIDIQKIYMTRLSPLIMPLKRLLDLSHEGSPDCKDTFPSSILLKYHNRYGIRKLLISYIIIFNTRSTKPVNGNPIRIASIIFCIFLIIQLTVIDTRYFCANTQCKDTAKVADCTLKNSYFIQV